MEKGRGNPSTPVKTRSRTDPINISRSLKFAYTWKTRKKIINKIAKKKRVTGYIKLIHLFRANYSADYSIERETFRLSTGNPPASIFSAKYPGRWFRWRKRKRSPDPLEKALIKDQTSLDESEEGRNGRREDILDLISSGMFVFWAGEGKRGER